MTCPGIPLADYVHDFLPANAARGVRDHLSLCGDCRRDLERLKGEREALAGWARAFQREYSAVGAPRIPVGRGRGARFGSALVMAAAFLLCGGVLWVVIAPSGHVPAQEGSAQSLIERLRSERVEEREEAIRKLKQLGKAARPELEKAARDDDPEVAARARQVLRVIEIQEQLTRNLRNAMPGVVDRLAEGGDPVWTEIFMQAVEDQGQGRRFPNLKKEDLEALIRRAIRGARTVDDKANSLRRVMQWRLAAAVPETIALLKDADPGVRRRAVIALAFLGAKEAAPQILELLKDPAYGDGEMAPMDYKLALSSYSDYVAPCAAKALRELGRQEEATLEAMKLLGHPDTEIRCLAVYSLGQLGAKEAIPELIKLLHSDVRNLRRSAVSALGTLEARGALPQIAKLLTDDDDGVCSEAIFVIGRLGGKEHVPEIVKIVQAKGKSNRTMAVQALCDLSFRFPEAFPHLVALLKDEDAGIRRQAAAGLGSMKEKEAIPHLLPLLEDGAAEVRGYATQSLGSLGATGAAPGIAKLLHDGDPFVRGRAIHALGLLGAGDRVSEIVKSLVDSDAGVRRSAIITLGRLKAREAIPPLLKALREKSASIDHDILWALKSLEAREAIPSVVALVEGLDTGDQLLAAQWLCEMGSREGVPVLLRNGKGLVVLNAIRQRDLWDRLHDTTLTEKWEGTSPDLAERAARSIGLALEWPPGEDPGADDPQGSVRAYGEGTLLYTVLSNAIGSDRLDRMVLDPGKVRILPPDQGLPFWKNWEGVQATERDGRRDK